MGNAMRYLMFQSINMTSSIKQHALLSIDIGVKNLGWTIFSSNEPLTNGLQRSHNSIGIAFGIYNITDNTSNLDSVVADRCVAVAKFFKRIVDNFILDLCVVERQVPSNTKAMELMYAITSAALCYLSEPSNLIIFDPKLKFQWLGLSYNTTNKAHKYQSIEMCKSLLIELTNEKQVIEFDKHPKRDDIADSFNQGIDCLAKEGLIDISLKNIRQMIASHNIA